MTSRFPAVTSATQWYPGAFRAALRPGRTVTKLRPWQPPAWPGHGGAPGRSFPGAPWSAPTPAPSRLAAAGSGGLVVLLDDGGRDPAAVADLETLLLRPGPDGGCLVTVHAGAGAAAAPAGPAGRARRAPGLPRRADVLGERVTQLGGVLAGQVDLVVVAVECEADRFRGFAAVEVVDEQYLDFLCHEFLFPPGVRTAYSARTGNAK